jgi:hypothetical protein
VGEWIEEGEEQTCAVGNVCRNATGYRFVVTVDAVFTLKSAKLKVDLPARRVIVVIIVMHLHIKHVK